MFIIYYIYLKNPSFLLKNIEIHLFLKSTNKPHPQSYLSPPD